MVQFPSHPWPGLSGALIEDESSNDRGRANDLADSDLFIKKEPCGEAADHRDGEQQRRNLDR